MKKKKRKSYHISSADREFARSLNPRPENHKNDLRTKTNACPRCFEDRLDNIIDLQRGARECRTCGKYYHTTTRIYYGKTK